MSRLNVNIDHIATIRQARRTNEPNPVSAAVICELAGADGITVHLRSDRRHIQDYDLIALKQVVITHLNVEMAATDEMVEIASRLKPDVVTPVAQIPEVEEFNIGHNIIARAALVGLDRAVREMIAAIRGSVSQVTL